MKYDVCVVSSSRADFGLLVPLLNRLENSETLNLKFIVTGSHLSIEFGHTVDEIEQANIPITAKVHISLQDTNAVDIGCNIANTIESFSTELSKISPHAIVVLGDRYEMLGVVIAAKCLNIPIIHIHGGELTLGAIDDSIRHSITKFSSLHFVCTDRYRKRVIQMGEQPDSVFNTGALSIDNIVNIQLLTRAELEKALGLKLHEKFIMVGFHSETLAANTLETCKKILAALEKINDATIIFTRPNADLFGNLIWTNFKGFCWGKADCHVFENLGSEKYLSCLAHCDMLVGNSSSGILEAPFLGAYTINIGDRQEGREKAHSVLDLSSSCENLLGVIDGTFSEISKNGRARCKSLFGEGKSSLEMVKLIEKHIPNIGTKKYFFDILD
jgi:GDP/UDP-N,N'-diacetylbacillosamine 2-epimerase (hydrolysing)